MLTIEIDAGYARKMKSREKRSIELWSCFFVSRSVDQNEKMCKDERILEGEK